jgi:hypothetical protein
MEPLRDDWAGARAAATQAAEAGDKETARKIVETFHGKLAQTKVLDPACGTGNFLYVSMARMKELEGEVLELLEELGDDQYLAEISGHTITPENFLGIEINPRAANIAQLVLWIGYLQWHFRVNGEDRMPEAPVLRDVKTIENRDAILDAERTMLMRDSRGIPVTRWDGLTTRLDPLSGKRVPDERSQLEVYNYINPRRSRWPTADFVIGNPPFIGNKRMRRRLGDGYVEALKRAYPRHPADVDFVMYWWTRAAEAVRSGAIRRFGLISTNSIRQVTNRQVVRAQREHLSSVSLAFAIADHPWRNEETDAAVRVSMTVGDSDVQLGRLEVITEEKRDPYEIARVGVHQFFGKINDDLTLGADVTQARPLISNKNLAFMGVIPVGDGFRIDKEIEEGLSLEDRATVRDYINGEDLIEAYKTSRIIDVSEFLHDELQEAHPAIFDLLSVRVRPFREVAERQAHRERWWVFGERRVGMRKALAGLTRYIATAETAKHRLFHFLNASILPDQKIRVVALCGGFNLGILSSRTHLVWSSAAGSTLEDRPVYVNLTCFDPFPFPDTSDAALKDRISNAAEKLDALRKEVLNRHSDLTLTKLYNVLDALRVAEKAGTVLSDKDRDVATRGRVSLIGQYHDTIDAAVAEAYGWATDLSDEEILERLVALNKQRTAEEAKGEIKWLRPDFQKPGYVAPKEQKTLALPETAVATAEILEWPKALPEQFTAVAAVVDRAAKPIAANDVARVFKGKNAKGVIPVLDTLAGMGRLRKLEDGRYAA